MQFGVNRIYDFILECGKANDPKSFAIEVLNNLDKLCSFDQALAYFFDGNGKICDQYLMNINKCWSTIYLEYYHSVDNQRYSCFMDERKDLNLNKITQRCINWENEPSTEFVLHYIRPRGLKYSYGFALFDLNGNYRIIFALDRVKKTNFGNEELMDVQLAIPLLNNLHKNFYYQGFNIEFLKRNTWKTANLTAREAEIANLLCQGVSPANISRILYISMATTYKHIANIYKKMHVSSQQELLVRLLRQQD